MFRPMRIVNKTAFLYHHSSMAHHFAPIEALLSDDAVRVSLGCQIDGAYPAEQLLSQDLCFDVLISNHYHEHYLTSGQYQIPTIKRLGRTNVRLMYSHGKDDWNYQDWNKYYDAFLCFGPVQADMLAQYKKPVYQIGYPRYDAYFNKTIKFDRHYWFKRLKLDPLEPIYAWLPTWGMNAKFLEQFKSVPNLIVKPHPLDKESDALLQGFQHYINDDIDNAILFKLADCVIAEYGGVGFGAVYVDKPVILLNDPDKPPTGYDKWLRQQLGAMNPGDPLVMPYDQGTARAKVREQLFVNNYGSSAAAAVDAIRLMRHNARV